jgi:hypothetical protein
VPQLFHLALGDVRVQGELHVEIRGRLLPLQAHDAASLRAAASDHPTLAMLPEAARASFTHFAQVDDDALPADSLTWIRVVVPAPDGIHLHQIVRTGLHVPPAFVRAHARRRLARLGRLGHPHLAHLGLAGDLGDDEAAVEAYVAAQTLVDEFSTATSLAMHHPLLANTQPSTTIVVREDHVAPDPRENPVQYNALKALARTIDEFPGDEWSPRIPCIDQNGEQMRAEFDIVDEDGKVVIKDGQAMYTNDVVDPVLQSSLPVVSGALRTSADDSLLQNKLWAVDPGEPVVERDKDVGGEPWAVVDALQAELFRWTADLRTRRFGLKVLADTISVDEADKLTVGIDNIYSRTLYAYFRRIGEDGKPFGALEAVRSIGAVNTIMGIPMPTDPVMLQMDLQKQSGVELVFGTLGTSDWSGEPSTYGALLTGLWQYGVPGLFMIAGAVITSTETFNKIVNDEQLRAAALAIAFAVLGGALPTASALINTKFVMITFASTVIGMLVKKGLEKLAAWVVARIGASQFAQAAGPVGWIFKLIQAGLQFSQIAITTGEVLSSPATIRAEVRRSLDVTLTLLPDPRHGESGRPETAVWPALAQRYLATLRYRNGTAFTQAGTMPAVTNSDPILIRFDNVPAGGEFTITAGVYSESGWLAGSWASEWIAAKPNRSHELALGEKRITENLVPLGGGTQYRYKESVLTSGGDYVWEARKTPPALTTSALDCGGGGTLCAIDGITISNTAQQVGYAFRASGQHLPPDEPRTPRSDAQLHALRNISVLAKPGSRRKAGEIGFTRQPVLAYSPYDPSPGKIDDRNFVLDPRGGGLHVRKVALDDGSQGFGFDRGDLPSWGRFPLDHVDAMVVHPDNALVAVSFQTSKMMILQIPDQPESDDKAREAVLVSGEGVRQGLMQGPVALAVAPDGRILVLETRNRRIQAFDVKGNAVASFSPREALFPISGARIGAELDGGKIPPEFEAALQARSLSRIFTLDPILAAHLDEGKLQPENDPVIEAFSLAGWVLAYDPEHMGDRKLSAYVRVDAPGERWRLIDPGRDRAYTIVREGARLVVFRLVTQFRIEVLAPDARWQIVDTETAESYAVARTGESTFEVRSRLAFAPLRAETESVVYLDLGVESQGYVYVLSRTGDGTKPTDYRLDIYGPDGSFVSRTPDGKVTKDPQNVVAAKIAVGIWRDVYGVTFETMRGPWDSPEPVIAHWIPTPPLFSFDLALSKALDENNISAVADAFAAKGEPLSKDAFVTTESSAGAWVVKDRTRVFNIYRSGDGLPVYAIPG